jgi:hypothetical protein
VEVHFFTSNFMELIIIIIINMQLIKINNNWNKALFLFFRYFCFRYFCFTNQKINRFMIWVNSTDVFPSFIWSVKWRGLPQYWNRVISRYVYLSISEYLDTLRGAEFFTLQVNTLKSSGFFFLYSSWFILIFLLIAFVFLC